MSQTPLAHCGILFKIVQKFKGVKIQMSVWSEYWHKNWNEVNFFKSVKSLNSEIMFKNRISEFGLVCSAHLIG